MDMHTAGGKSDKMSISEEEEIKRTLEMFEESQNWFNDHYAELEKEYGDMLVAIKDKEVLSVATTVEDLLEDLKMKNEAIGSVYIGSIPPKGTAFIL